MRGSENHAFRLDRSLTMGFFDPMRRCLGTKKTGKLPILMYHSIADSGSVPTNSYLQLHTPPEIFKGHMECIQRLGFRVVGLAKGVEGLFSGSGADERTLVLTFDDAYRDFFRNAGPVLEAFGFTATIFVPTGMAGKVMGRLGYRECMSWEELSFLARNGFEIGSHSVSHRKLVGLRGEELTREIADSKDEIEQRTGGEVSSFSYPYAFPDWDRDFVEICREILKKQGYRRAVTTRAGRASEKDGTYSLRRIPVSGADDLRFFEAKITGGYDWFGFPQALFKKIKSLSFGSGRPSGG